MSSWRGLAENSEAVAVDDTAGEQTCSFRAIALLVHVCVDKVPIIVLVLVTFCLRLVVCGIGYIAIESGDSGLLSAIALLGRLSRHRSLDDDRLLFG